MTRDFRDVRFSTAQGAALPHWRESYSEGVTSTFWVKLPALETGINFYYGNGQAVSASDGKNTFELFDDFDSTLDTGVWTPGYFAFENNGAWALSNPGYNAPDTYQGSLRLGGTRTATDTLTEDGETSSYIGRAVRSVTAIPLTNFKIEASIKYSETSEGDYEGYCESAIIGVGKDKNNYIEAALPSSGETEFMREVSNVKSNTGHTVTTYSKDVWRRYIFTFIDNGTCVYSIDGVTSTRAAGQSLSSKYVFIAFGQRAPSAVVTQLTDWVFVRKYTATEPTLSILRAYPRTGPGYLPEGPDLVTAAATMGISPALIGTIGGLSAAATMGISPAYVAGADVIAAVGATLGAAAAASTMDIYLPVLEVFRPSYQAWKFKGDIRVNNYDSTPGALSKIILSWAPGMAQDFSDVRFSGPAGQPIRYYTGDTTAGVSATFWLKLPVGLSKIHYYYGNGQAVSESSLTDLDSLFSDDLETGVVDTDKWATKINSVAGHLGSVGIRTDKKYGAYSIGIDQPGAMGDGVGIYDQCHALIKIPLDSVPVGSIFGINMKARRWKETDWYGHFAGFGYGDTSEDSELYNFSWDDIFHDYLTVVERTAETAWSFTFYRDGVLDYTVTRTFAFDTNFTYGVQTRHNSASDNSLFVRIDNVAAFIQASTTLTVLGHYPAHLSPGAYLRLIDGHTALQAAQAVTLLDKITPAAAIEAAVGVSTYSDYDMNTALQVRPAVFVKEFLNLSTAMTAALVGSIRSVDTLAGYDVGEVEVSKSVTDAFWQLSAEFFGDTAPVDFTPLHHEAADYAGVNHHLFTGINPTSDKTMGSAGNKTQVTAYDYGWYLSAQFIPNDSRVMEVSTIDWPWSPFADWESWIEHLLEETGITAYRIRAGPSTFWKQFIFSNKTTKREAIDAICKYCNYVFEVKWHNYGDDTEPDWRPVAYWVPQAEIDDDTDGLDIPSPLTLNWPDPYLVDLPKITMNPEEKINRVRIIGSNGEGNFYSATRETDAVSEGTELPREYMEESSNLTTQTQVNDYADSMLNYFKRPSVTVTMRFIQRFDIELYQKIKFGAGFPAELVALTDGTDGINYLRITGIKYHTGPANNYVDVTAVYDHPIVIIKSRHRYLKPNWFLEIEESIRKGLERQAKTVAGTIESVDSDGKTGVMITEFGGRISVRIQ